MKRCINVILLSFCLLFLALAPVSAVDVSVDNTWTSDQIEDAIDNANNGDIFRFAEGFYNKVVLNINRSVKLIVQGTIILNGTSKKNVISLNASNVSIEGFTIQNGLNGIGSLNPSLENVKIENNTFKNNTNNGMNINVQSGDITKNTAYSINGTVYRQHLTKRG
jgi:nitrous oxidase accessory protein